MRYFAIYSIFIALTEASKGGGEILAVLEYRPSRTNDSLTANTRRYEDIMKMVAPSKQDLLIFPESTLTLTPEDAVELTVSENPCLKDSYPSFIRNISCTIKKTTTYAVINLIQKVCCTPTDKSPNCKTYGSYLYNTNVVFDRTGTIIGLYHKYNVLGEKPLNRPSVPEEVIIETDFGVNFSIFTGSDILFKRPAEDLVAKKVDVIIYPTQWYSELPFLTALQTQQMWSQAHNVKLLAVGANNPQVGSGGSGLFRGAEDSDFANIKLYPVPSLTYFNWPVEGKRGRHWSLQIGKYMDYFYLNIDPNITEYTSTILDTSEKDFNGQVCHDGGGQNRLCCNFTIKITTSNNSASDKNMYTYHMVAFSGIRPFRDVHYIGVEFCAIIACLNSSVSSCGRRFPSYNNITWPLTFEEITIKANFESSENKTQYPNSLLSSIKPVEVSETRWEKEEIEVEGNRTIIQRTFSLTEPQNKLLTFAIYGRNFGQDYDNPSVQSIDTDDEDNANNSVQSTSDDEDNANNSVQSTSDMDLAVLVYSSIVVLLRSYLSSFD